MKEHQAAGMKETKMRLLISSMLMAIKSIIHSQDLIKKNEKEIEDLIHKINNGDFDTGVEIFYGLCAICPLLSEKYRPLLNENLNKMWANSIEREAK